MEDKGYNLRSKKKECSIPIQLQLATALLPIIAGYQLSPDRIQIDITSPKVASQVSQIRYNYFQSEWNRYTTESFQNM